MRDEGGITKYVPLPFAHEPVDEPSPLTSLVFALACGDDSAPADAGTDALSDATLADALLSDANATDGGPRDTGPSDAAPDVAMDAGASDAPWAWCPSAADFVGDATWMDRIVVPGIVWCVMGDENRSLEEDMAEKAQLWVATGEYPFPPRETGAGAMTLPFCINTVAGQGPALAGDGAFDVSVGDFQSTFSLVSTLDDDTEFSIEIYNESEDDTPWPGGALNAALSAGGFGPPGTASGSLRYGHRLGDCAGNEEWNEVTVNATFAAGSVDFSFRAVPGSVSTGPSGGFRAQGTLDGTAFDVDDYFRIFYAAEHHHFGGEYAVFFDEPIRDACGLRVNATFEDRSLRLVDCDLETLETIDDATITGSFD